jgi:hypothetical protein
MVRVAKEYQVLPTRMTLGSVNVSGIQNVPIAMTDLGS